MKLTQKFSLVLMLLCVALVFQACKKNNTDPSIASVSRTAGPTGKPFTITGSNFNSDAQVVFTSSTGVETPGAVDFIDGSQLKAYVANVADGSYTVSVVQGGSRAAGPSFTVRAPNVTVSTLAGNGNGGYTDGTGTAATFSYPYDVAVNPVNGNIYVADYYRIRVVTPAGIVTTLAGSDYDFADGTGTAAKFRDIQAIAFAPNGDLIVTDGGNYRLRRVTTAGVVTTIAGTGVSGFADGAAASAQLNYPWGLAAASNGELFFTTYSDHRIRKLASGTVSTLAGSGTNGSTNGTGTAASFRFPTGIGADRQGNLYLADNSNGKYRKITPAGVVTDFAPAVAGGSINPVELTVDPVGNVYVAEQGGGIIARIPPSGLSPSIVVGSAYNTGFVDGAGTTARISYSPYGLALDNDGNLILADSDNYRIRKVVID